MNTAEINITAIIISLGISIFLVMLGQFMSRYFKYLDDKKKEVKDKETADNERTEKITIRLDALRDSFVEMSHKYSQIFEKVHDAGILLNSTVKEVSEMKIDVEILKQINGIKTKRNESTGS